jgi:hypothetical protein
MECLRRYTDKPNQQSLCLDRDPTSAQFPVQTAALETVQSQQKRGSYRSDHELCLLECDAVNSRRNLSAFQSKKVPTFSGLRKKSWKQAE